LSKDPDGVVESLTEVEVNSSSVGSSISSNPDARSNRKRARVEIFETIISKDLVIQPEILSEEDISSSPKKIKR